MGWIFPYVVLVGLIVFMAVLRLAIWAVEKRNERYPFVAKKHLLSEPEQRLYTELVREFGGRYAICPKVHLPSVLDAVEEGAAGQAQVNRLIRKALDFVICDRDANRTLLVIEMDDWAHDLENRVAREQFVDKALNAAGIPLLRLKTKDLEQILVVTGQIARKLEGK